MEINDKFMDIHRKSFDFLKSLSEKHKLSETSSHTHDKAIRGLILYIFCESFILKPKLIVELGTGEFGPYLTTNGIFEFISNIYDAKLISVDHSPEAIKNIGKRSEFVSMDDAAFANEFKMYCDSHGINDKIDLLFIDTEKSYDHMVDVINKWFPFVSDSGLIMVHDTGTLTTKPWIQVRKALEDTLNIRLNTEIDYTDHQNGWFIRHTNANKGLTVLSKSRA